jgi:hypothetical protein
MYIPRTGIWGSFFQHGWWDRDGVRRIAAYPQQLADSGHKAAGTLAHDEDAIPRVRSGDQPEPIGFETVVLVRSQHE